MPGTVQQLEKLEIIHVKLSVKSLKVNLLLFIFYNQGNLMNSSEFI